MLSDLKEIRQCVNDDVQIMETMVGKKTASVDVVDNRCSASLINSFENMYYDLAACAEVHSFSLLPSLNTTNSGSSFLQQSSNLTNLSCFQLPKRKFPTFSGVVTEW